MNESAPYIFMLSVGGNEMRIELRPFDPQDRSRMNQPFDDLHFVHLVLSEIGIAH